MDIFHLKLRKKQKQFEKLLNPILDKLYKIAFSYMKKPSKSEDVLQDSILIAYERLDSLKDINKFNSWITSILINKCKETLRHDNIIHFEELYYTASNIIEHQSNQYKNIDINIDLINYINLLDDKYSDVIILKYFADYTIKDIANTLEIPEGTVKSRLNSAMKKLKEIMNKEGFIYNEL
ncbi:RNA polymerase [Clostridium novyi A str. 4552]|uniref:RNA polymerase sigma factor n=1 Tax=Clostridium novyi A str. 4552 TaxID=1444289 RepID=A0A0A0I6A4_CLONO|nr:RNA polymerase sigma factor [Clostridium novyi]KGM96954.1 RNA polymerase [Clostridium novyi A str. 4552]